MSDILADLEAVRKQAESITVGSGYQPKQLYLTGWQFIACLRHGILRPGDGSVDVLIPGPDQAMVQEFLKTFTGPDL